MNFDFTQTNEQLSDIENYLKQEYLQISTGRANPALLDGINVESYGSFQPIKNIASITLRSAANISFRRLDIVVSKSKSLLSITQPFPLYIVRGL